MQHHCISRVFQQPANRKVLFLYFHSDPVWVRWVPPPAQIYTSILRIGLVAAGGVFVAGVFVLPSLAGDDLRLKVASIIGVSPSLTSHQDWMAAVSPAFGAYLGGPCRVQRD